MQLPFHKKLFLFPLALLDRYSLSVLPYLLYAVAIPAMFIFSLKTSTCCTWRFRATMELYKKSKINPISGCLPMLVQIPFLFALYYVLIAVVQLRQAHFIFWIHDLAAKDPYYILPILMGISMYFTTKLSPTSLDAAQSKMMLAMPVIFTILFASFPSGLVLYWLVNNVASLLQQWYVTRKQSSAIQKV